MYPKGRFRRTRAPAGLDIDNIRKTCIMNAYARNGRVPERACHKRAADAEKRRRTVREHGPGASAPDR